MAKGRASYSKLQRERDNKAKAAAKQERRIAAREAPPEEPEPTPVRQVDEEAVIAALEKLHKDFDDGNVNDEDFQNRREELLSKLTIT